MDSYNHKFTSMKLLSLASRHLKIPKMYCPKSSNIRTLIRRFNRRADLLLYCMNELCMDSYSYRLLLMVTNIRKFVTSGVLRIWFAIQAYDMPF